MALTVRIRGDASQFDKTMRGVKSTIGGLSSKIAGIGAAALGAATAYMTLSTAFDAIKSASEKAAGMEDLTLQLELLTGSADKAKSMIKLFRDEAAKSPLSSEDYAQAAKTLMAFGMAADDTVPIMKSLADISMGNSERFGSLSLAFAQTQAAGRLMGQEVLQFVNAGFNPLQQISLKTGESMATLKKRMEDGAISAAEVTQAFIDATSAGGKFYGAIQKGADSTNAKIAQTKDNIDKLQIAFGTGFNEGLKDALDATNSFLPQLEKRFEAAGDFVGQAISKAVQGNTEELAMVGSLIAESILAGFKAVYLKGMDELVGVGQNGFSTALEQFRALATKGELIGMGEAASRVVGRGTNVESASLASYIQTAMEDVKGGATASAIGKSMLDSQSTRIAKNLGAGFNQNLTNPMMQALSGSRGNYNARDPFADPDTISSAVTDGVLKAFTRQPQVAKFAN